MMAAFAALLAGAIWWVSGGRHEESDAPALIADWQAGAASDFEPKPAVGLMGTLPIYWGEVADIEDILRSEGQQHWARRVLETRYRLEPLDTLDGDGGLARLDYLLLAQPRALSGSENVALDRWVREGGRVLLFADPLLTGESRFAIGDRRRPQDVVLLSPILARWGLELLFDEDQPDRVQERSVAGQALPIHLAGHFRLRPSAGGGESACILSGTGLVAECTVGEGGILVVADAALLESGAREDAKAPVLLALARRAFDSPAPNFGK